MTNLIKYLATFRKIIVGLIGFTAVLTSQVVLPAPYDKYTGVLVALATALGVYSVPNKSTTPTPVVPAAAPADPPAPTT